MRAPNAPTAKASRNEDMATHRTTYSLLIGLILSAVCFSACTTPEKLIKRARNAEALGEYCEAGNLYKRAYRLTPAKDRKKRGEIAYSMGEAFRRYGNTARALGAYQSAERMASTDTFTLLRLGDMLMMRGDYSGAQKKYEVYLETHPDDASALRGKLNAASAQAIKDAGSLYTVQIDKLFNSSRADFSPAFVGSEAQQLLFTSTRSSATGQELSGITGMKCGDLFYAKKDEKGKWKQAEPVDGSVNTDWDEGACQTSQDGTTMYYTVCRTDPQYPRFPEIWKSTRTDAKWGKGEQVKITSDTLSTYAHPALHPNGRWLYFVSDMPGGEGGMDIWRVQIDAHGVGAVENLGKEINTAGNEMFPTFRPSGELYFSSDGRSPSLGGLDLYRAKEDTVTHRWKVEHLPYPVNSQGDDFSMTFDGLHNRGFFSSNRSTGGRGWDKIYSFSYPERLQTVKGWVYEQDGYELPEATVYIVGNDGTYEKRGVGSDGSFEYPLTAGTSYLFLATCKGFLNVRAELVADSGDVEKQHVLQFPLPSISTPVLVRNVFYDFDKATIAENSREALERLGNMLRQNPNVTIELSAHCDYRGNDAYNMNLSQRRAESVVKYLTENGIAADRLTAKGYGESQPKVVTRKLAETYAFLHEGDSLTEAFIKKLPEEQQETCNALNRRTEFRVLRTTYGLFDDQGRLRPDALKSLQRKTEIESEGEAEEEQNARD